MIKVIAADMDGTLLNPEHTMSEYTYQTILAAQRTGYRFMIATGRDFPGAMGALADFDLTCDYITGSGAEIRSEKGEILKSVRMDSRYFKEIYQCADKFQGAVRFCAAGTDYFVGEPETVERQVLEESRLFLGEGTDEELKSMKIYRQMVERIRCVKNVEEIIRKEIPVHKIFIAVKDGDTAHKVREEMKKFPHLAVASSFFNNIELTDEEAQKGTAISRYAESLGYQKDEVMVLGDSLNDLSMFQEGFGATVAMENADEVIKEHAQYITKSNREDGAAYAIRLMMGGRLGELKN